MRERESIPYSPRVRTLLIGFLLLAMSAGPAGAQDPPPARHIDPLLLVRRTYLRLADRLPTAEELDRILEEADIDILTDRLLQSNDFLELRKRLWIEWLGIEREADLQWIHNEVSSNSPAHRRLRDWFANRQPLAKSDEEAFTLLERLGPRLLGEGFSCTRCHDHPYLDATQEEFFSLAAFLRPGGNLAPQETFYRNRSEGDPISARIPRRLGQGPPRLASSSGLDDAGLTVEKSRRDLARFGRWVGKFPDNPLTEQLLLARILEEFTGQPALVRQVQNEVGEGGDAQSLGKWLSLWRHSGYDEVALIRSLVTSPGFVGATSNPVSVRSSNMAATSWARSVQSITGIIPKKPEMTPEGDSFLERSRYLTSLLQALPPGELDLDQTWLLCLGRPPTAEERTAASKAKPSAIYHAIFLSDEFSLIP